MFFSFSLSVFFSLAVIFFDVCAVRDFSDSLSCVFNHKHVWIKRLREAVTYIYVYITSLVWPTLNRWRLLIV